MKFRPSKLQNEVTREWDAIAATRDAQLRSNQDRTFSEVLRPHILASVTSAQSIIDIGCGTGNLTSSLNATNRRVVGLDPSRESIRIARLHDSSTEYHEGTLEAWSASNQGAEFDLAIVNMVLMDVMNLSAFTRALAQVVQKGRVLATLTHPAFWPLYWGYSAMPGFDYMKDQVIEAPFRTNSQQYDLPTTHIHRPISTYIEAFRAVGLSVDGITELRGPESLEEFAFPRFLAFDLFGQGRRKGA